MAFVTKIGFARVSRLIARTGRMVMVISFLSFLVIEHVDGFWVTVLI